LGGGIYANHELQNPIVVYCNEAEIDLADYLTIPNDGIAYEYLWKVDWDDDGSFDYDLSDKSADASYPYTPLNLSIDESTNINLWVYDPEGFVCTYASNITVKAKKIPLGHTIPASEEDCFFKIYIPTQYQSQLVLQSAGASLEKIIRPWGEEESAGWSIDQGLELPINTWNQGWHQLFISNVNDSISTIFTQSASAAKRPWNFYWWGYDNDRENGRPSLWNYAAGVDEETPLFIYDLNFNNSEANNSSAPAANSRMWEKLWSEAQADNSSAWHGHCDGLTKASIFLNDPEPIDTELYGLSVNELKGLYGEMFEGHMNYEENTTIGYGMMAGDPGIVSEVPNETSDEWAGEFHYTVEKFINAKTPANRIALYSDLGISAYNNNLYTGDYVERWNHALFEYDAVYKQANVDTEGNERMMLVEITLKANCDGDFGADTCAADAYREVSYSYVVEYNTDGYTDYTAESNWISVGGSAKYIPARVSSLLPTLEDMVDLLDHTDKTTDDGQPPQIPDHLFDFMNVFALDKNNNQ